jgi:transposase InsO family protein
MAGWEDYLQSIYYNPEHPGAFGGPSKLHAIVRKEGKHKISLNKIKFWLQDQDSYSLNRFSKETGIKSYVPSKLGSHFQSDLADVNNISEFNNGVKFLLIVIDTLSRYLWVGTLKDKKHDSIIKSFKNLFPQGLKCKVLTTDNGTEYKNRWFRNYLKDNYVYHYTTNTTRKAGLAERVISTLKFLMYRYFTYKRSYNYLDVIEQLVQNYNNTPHRSLFLMPPSEINENNQAKIWKKIYVDRYSKTKKSLKGKKPTYKFKVKDLVRVSLIRGSFARSYHEKWSREINIIKSRFHQSGIPSYRLTDYHEEVLEGIFYENELQLVHKNKDNLWVVDKVLKRRTYRKKKQSLVSFEGWRPKFNEWVNDSDIETIN